MYDLNENYHPDEDTSNDFEFKKHFTDDPNMQKPPVRNQLAMSSFMTGIIALAGLILCGAAPASLVFGSLGIIFALLSKIGKMDRMAKTGLIISTIAVVVSIVMIAISTYIIVTSDKFGALINTLNNIDFNSVNAMSDYYSAIEEFTRQLSSSMPSLL